SPELVTVMVSKLATFMNVVGSTAVAFTVTTLTPVAAFTAELKKSAAAVGSPDVVPRNPLGKFALNIRVASSLGLPLLMLRAAASAAPSTAFDNWALTTYALPVSTARPVKTSSPV